MGQKSRAIILVAEDDKRMSRLVQQFLTDADFVVVPVTNGNEALQAFNDAPNDFDLFLTDFNMPGLNGFEAAVRIREVRPEMPVVFMSAHAEALGALGGSLHLQKPFSPERLVETVAGCLIRSGG